MKKKKQHIYMYYSPKSQALLATLRLSWQIKSAVVEEEEEKHLYFALMALMKG